MRVGRRWAHEKVVTADAVAAFFVVGEIFFIIWKKVMRMIAVKFLLLVTLPLKL